MTTLFHADDYGITVEQARAILALSGCHASRQAPACGATTDQMPAELRPAETGNVVTRVSREESPSCASRALNSVSAFANSPAFEEAAALAAPFVAQKTLRMGLHVNLVEGYPCANARDIPLLVGARGTFCNDFLGLLKRSWGPARSALRTQIQAECVAQIERFLAAFPEAHGALRLDSHQHTHAIPLVLDALMAAAQQCRCTLEHVRTPVEPLQPHLASGQALRRLSPANLAKDALLSCLWTKNRAKLPEGCATSLFCGVLLSGRMDEVDASLVRSFDELAGARARAGKALADGSVEVLFHPVSVALDECLDPQNTPFATACAAPSRDAEARTLATFR